jgi:hypothetical protein
VNANVPRVRELQAALKAKADKTPPGQWVEGIMFDDTKLDVVLTKRFLDEVTRDHPLVVNHRGGHTSWYNSKAFELAGVTRTRPPDPAAFPRQAATTGRVAELARGVFAKVGTRETFTPDSSAARPEGCAISELRPRRLTPSRRGANRDRILACEDAEAGELRHRAGFLARPTLQGFKAPASLRLRRRVAPLVGSSRRRRLGLRAHHAQSTPYVGTNDYGSSP